jgi:glycosyltransferase involved in cell wall biosynthesis
MKDISGKLPVSVLIMTQNEEENIGFALKAVVPYFDQVIVMDSFSSDRTAEVVRGFKGVEFYTHKFEGWAEQRNWMLENCEISNKTVFFLDADEYPDDKFIRELSEILKGENKFSSIKITPKYIFMGQNLRFAYDHPKIKRIFSEEVRFVGEGAREYAVSDGLALELSCPLIHEDRRPLSVWFAKHNNNSDREAALFMAKQSCGVARQGGLETRFGFKIWVRHNVWDRLPLLLRPFLYFFYRYVVKMGFLDGIPGLVYCLLHGLIYQLMIGVKIMQLQSLSNERV